MRQRWLLNLALLVIILILGGVIFYTLETDKEPKTPTLTELEADQVQQIYLERYNDEPISLRKDSDGFWQMTTPLHLPANTFKIDRLLEILTERDYQKLDLASPNLTDFSLEPPLASIKFDQFKIAFGGTSPMNDGKRYLLIDQHIYLLPDTVYYSIGSNAVKFVDMSPLGHKPKIQALKMPDYHFVLTEGTWTVTSTFTADEIDTGQDALNSLIENWERISAFNVERYEEDENTAFQGDIEVTLVGQEQMLHVAILSTTPDLVLIRPDKGVRYEFSNTQVDRLLHLPTKAKETESTEEDLKKKAEDVEIEMKDKAEN
jgi:hypothetical protein